jgi:hypothetical protein
MVVKGELQENFNKGVGVTKNGKIKKCGANRTG